MTQTTERLRKKVRSAGDLKSVVRTMKNWAAISIGPYERAVAALADYYRAVELGLMACLRDVDPQALERATDHSAGPVGAIVFGTDQGMVGQLNEQLAEFALTALTPSTAPVLLWPIGERIAPKLAAPGVEVRPFRRVPDSVDGITPLVGELLVDVMSAREESGLGQVYLFHNRPARGAGCAPTRQRILPFDAEWLAGLRTRHWPTKLLPQVRPAREQTFAALVREYLFISIFRACAESLASENRRRYTAMQGAEDNIDRLQERLRAELNHTRQSAIDEELFDVVAGFEALR